MLEFQKGNVPAFETLMRKYYARILNFSYRFVGDRDTAEDLAQEVFIKVHRSGSSYRPQAKFQTWIYTIAKNLSLNAVRSMKRQAVSLDQDVDGEDGAMQRQLADPKAEHPAQVLQRQETAVIVQEAVNSLPENQKLAVILRRYERLSYEAIAETMGCSPEAVKSLLNRAKENLKVKLSHLLHMPDK